MKDKGTSNIKYIVGAIVLVVVVLALIAILFFYNPLRMGRIKKQLQDQYGVEFSADTTNGIKGKIFLLKSKNEGVKVRGTCDFFGNVKTENYVNYYYADECKQDIYDKIGDYFDDCIVVANFITDSRLCVTEFPFKSINSYEDYLNATKDLVYMQYHVRVRVYLREQEDLEHVVAAREFLESTDEYIWVSFYAIPDDYYDALKKSGIYCIDVGDYMDEFNGNVDDENYDRNFHYTYGHEGQIIE